MAWLAAQKPRGKTIGAIGGAFIAFSWGHVHDKILAKMNIRFNRLYTKFAIFAVISTIFSWA